MTSASLLILLRLSCLLGVQVVVSLQQVSSTVSSSLITSKVLLSNGGVVPLSRHTRSITQMKRVELHGPPVPHRKTLYVEAVVFADYTIYTHYGARGGGGGGAAIKRITDILSIANKVLSPIGVVLIPTEIKVWHSDEISVTSTLKTNINNLQRHRQRFLNQYPDKANDYTILLTRKKQKQTNGSCGAPFKGMCRKEESVSVVQDEGKKAVVTGVVLAHQVGHSLGIQHDNHDSDDTCRCTSSVCVMSPHFRNASTSYLRWSECSKHLLDTALTTMALDCLNNLPTRLHPNTGVCGNGVVDDGEQCDCGPEEVCDNPCCDAATCRLSFNASCASGSCCDIQKCKPRPPGSVCRSAITECDLPEFCSGHSEYCPKDVTKADGTSCHEGYCFAGECGSREGQCKRVWGQSASAASVDCYSKVNVRGNHVGNCGMRRGRFKQCTDEEALCGTLHCTVGSASSTHLLPEHRNGSARVGPHQCHFISGSEDYPSYHWLTPNGAPCGHEKMCINQQCRPLPKATGACHGGCSGRGVCNSLGHCHCEAGFSPPDCLLTGLGGSVDSNVMSGVSDPWVMLTLLWVAAVLVVSLVAVICCLWGCFKGWYKRKGRDAISASLPCCAACLEACCCPVMTKSVHWILTVGSSEEKKQMKRDIEVQEGADEHMLCSVDVDVKGSSKANTWGVASDTLVTEIVNVTPKDSPDFRRKVILKSNSPLLHHRSEDNLNRPKYQQSISVDSGCPSDTEEDVVHTKRASLELSMSSLLSLVMRFGDKKSQQTNKDIATRREKQFVSQQKSVPLSRFVVDPLAGRGSSSSISSSGRPSFTRSLSTQSTAGKNKRGTPPQLSQTKLKPNKSEEHLSNNSATLRFQVFQKSRHSTTTTDITTPPTEHIDNTTVATDVTTNKSKVPLRPPMNNLQPSPPRIPPMKLKTTSSPQTTNQHHQRTKNYTKHTRLLGNEPPSNSSLGSQNSSPDTPTSSKIIEMARKFEKV